MKNSIRRSEAFGFYRSALQTLQEEAIPFLVTGAFAFENHTGIVRKRKDMDISVFRRDVERTLAVFSRAGYGTDLKFPHWLGKIYEVDQNYFIDVIFSSGNGVCEIDQGWFDHAVAGQALNVPVRFCSPEDLIWQKSFVMERERYDGADVAHLVLAQHERLDWERLLSRFERHWRVLLSHLVLFGYIYPSERTKLPRWVCEKLILALEREMAAPAPPERVCQGTFLSRSQYIWDLHRWNYRDARHHLSMTPEETARWENAALDGND